jgi:hypothetical protein
MVKMRERYAYLVGSSSQALICSMAALGALPIERDTSSCIPRTSGRTALLERRGLESFVRDVRLPQVMRQRRRRLTPEVGPLAQRLRYTVTP